MDNSILDQISNSLDDIRREIRIANQLKLLELDYRGITSGQADDFGKEESWRYTELRKILITDGYDTWVKANTVLIEED